jgi:ergothioneine biosynthesis protein EgtB
MLTQDTPHDSRRLSGAALAAALRDSRKVLLSRVTDLDDAQWRFPYRVGVNPIPWELGHVGWFGEFWVLRGPHRVDSHGFVNAQHPPRFVGPDDCFDSARLAHARRWDIEPVSRQALLDRLQAQLEACVATVPADGRDDQAAYMHRLTLFHEDMHAEALAWLRGVLGFGPPPGCELPPVVRQSELHMDGGTFHLGWPAGRQGFAFDNELPSCPREGEPFSIDAAPVTAGQFLRFVEAGGYANAAWWPGDAGAWRAAATHPERWRRREAGRWEVRWFDRWDDLNPEAPVIHVNAWEAEAYCRWAGRRLPSAAEWEFAATTAAPAEFQWGHSVWEWTATPFEPYPGFQAGPYKDYSAPWFHDHRELRGGSFATHARMHDVRYRNFFQPHRRDVFAGFRTAALKP